VTDRYTYVGLRAFLDRACSSAGSSVFLHFRGREWTYADLGDITDGAAAAWWGLGLRPGSRVAMLLPNGPEHLFSWLSVVKLGAVAAPIHPDASPPEVAAALDLLQPEALVYDTVLAERLSASSAFLNRMPIRVVAGDASPNGARGTPTVHLEEILAARGALRGVQAPGPEQVAEILTTSGTTGRPKAVMQTHRTSVITGEAFAHWLGLSPNDRLSTCLPMSHINARSYSTLGAIAARATLAVERRFSASRFWQWIVASEATQTNAIGAMLHILLRQPPGPDDRRHGLRLIYAAPALGEEAHEAFERRFATRVVIGYGLTESTFGFIHPLERERKLGSMGRPRRHPHPDVPAEVRLVTDGRDAQVDEPGEIWLRNPASCLGYLDDEEQTRATLEGGWVHTGDVARRDAEGFYTFVGRMKHIIRRRGENLSPAEVEAVLESHPDVVEAAVIGVPSPLGEEDVRAYVVLRDGDGAKLDELRHFCAARLAPFKVPGEFRIVDKLPRTPTQRIAYHLLPRD
jgi:crotonobetaine/carnitine-CoA ligase